MAIKRGAREFSNEEFLEALKQRKFSNDYQAMTHSIACHLELFVAEFSGTHFFHAFSVIKTVLADYFVDKKNVYDFENIIYLHDDICGWRNGEFEKVLKSENIDLKQFKFNFLNYADYCYELFSFKNNNGIYLLELPDEKVFELDESDFFALSIFTYHMLHPTSHKDDGYWFRSTDEALEGWLSMDAALQEHFPITLNYDKVLNAEYWFSIINELFLYFQNSLIRNGRKIAISREKSRIAKIKAENDAKVREPKLRQLEKIWDDGEWTKKGRGKYTNFAKHILYNDMVENIEYDAIRNHISRYDKRNC